MINPLKQVDVNEFVFRHPSIPDTLAGLRIAQITDVHMGRWVKPRHLRQVVDLVNASAVDLVALTGDYVGYDSSDLVPCLKTLSALTPLTFGVLGNHDHWTSTSEAVRAFALADIPLLSNAATRVTLQQTSFDVVGVDDHVTRHADVERAFASVGNHGFCLALNHVPAIAPACAERGAHLILSGHTHGFQFNVPRLTHGIAERFGAEYFAGPYRIGRSYLYISRGLGSASWPWRLRAAPELTFFELLPSSEIHLELRDHHTVAIAHRP